jgi:hypothetical protein
MPTATGAPVQTPGAVDPDASGSWSAVRVAPEVSIR